MRLKWFDGYIQFASAAAAGITIIISCFAIAKTNLFLVNESDSIQRGIYVRTFSPVVAGSTVSVPSPKIVRDYIDGLAIHAWASDDRERFSAWSEFMKRTPILKHVVAAEGDVFCREAITGKYVAGERVLPAGPDLGPDGSELPSWNACTTLRDGEIAVYGDGAEDSLDSRVFGVIPSANAKTYTLLVGFEN